MLCINRIVNVVKIEHLYEKYIDEIDSFITEEGLKKSGAWLVPENSLIFSNGATIGECSINRIPVVFEEWEASYSFFFLKIKFRRKKKS